MDPTSTSDIIIGALNSALALDFIEANFYIMTKQLTVMPSQPGSVLTFL